jgi:molybdopterin-guanine dinucleotide biosynthesis protein MobB
MKLFGISGFKNAGKTTLVVDLIKEFRQRGLRVATIKHAHHEFDIDHPGKDSYQHREAGAEEIIVTSSHRWAHIRELNDAAEPPLEELLDHLGDVDLVLVEGYKYGRHPKLELRRAGIEQSALADRDDSIRAIVSDSLTHTAGTPVLAREDVSAIADFILKESQDPFQLTGEIPHGP